jgi:hypothetical protein
LDSSKVIEELFNAVKRAEQATREIAESPDNTAMNPQNVPHRESKADSAIAQKADEAVWSERG